MKLLDKIRIFPFVLAPLAGYTDHPFRLIAKKYGASLVFTEMVSVHSMLRHLNKLKSYMYYSLKERPVGLQIFGSDSKLFENAARIGAELKFDLIDINFGCPVHKVTRAYAGAYLHKDIKAVEATIKNTVKGAGKVPVSIKMRLGWDEKSKNFLELAKIAEDNGVKIITLHPRTRAQMFKGKAEWDYIAELKKKTNLFVIGNGDVHDRESAYKLLDETGCDAVMIGRAAIGNPFIFKEIKKEGYVPSLKERVKSLTEHYKLMQKFRGDKAVFEIRKYYGKYLKGFPGVSEIRKELVLINDKAMILKKLNSIMKQIKTD